MNRGIYFLHLSMRTGNDVDHLQQVVDNSGGPQAIYWDTEFEREETTLLELAVELDRPDYVKFVLMVAPYCHINKRDAHGVPLIQRLSPKMQEVFQEHGRHLVRLEPPKDLPKNQLVTFQGVSFWSNETARRIVDLDLEWLDSTISKYLARDFMVTERPCQSIWWSTVKVACEVGSPKVITTLLGSVDSQEVLENLFSCAILHAMYAWKKERHSQTRLLVLALVLNHPFATLPPLKEVLECLTVDEDARALQLYLRTGVKIGADDIPKDLPQQLDRELIEYHQGPTLYLKRCQHDPRIFKRASLPLSYLFSVLAKGIK